MTCRQLDLDVGDESVAVEPVLLLVSSLDQNTREYVLAAAAKHARIWLLTHREPTWELSHIIGHTVVDTLDPDALINAAASIPCSGVLCWDETRLLAAARLAQARNVPGPAPDAVRVCRDKSWTRDATAGHPQTRVCSRAVATLSEARLAADGIGYPVVLKPRALSSSFGASLARTPSELPRAFELSRGTQMSEVRETFDEPVLVEEFLEGPEISVDALCLDGRVTPLFVARKTLGYSPYFEEIGHAIDAADPLMQDPALAEALTRVHAAVGLTTAWTHTEWKLTSRGPILVEINARSGGGMIPYIGLLATGIDVGRTAVDLALGRPPNTEPTRARAAAIRFLYPPADCSVAAVSVDYDLLPRGIDTVRVLAEPGTVLQLPPAAPVQRRYGLIIAAGTTVDECEGVLDRAAEAVSLSFSPLSK